MLNIANTHERDAYAINPRESPIVLCPPGSKFGTFSMPAFYAQGIEFINHINTTCCKICIEASNTVSMILQICNHEITDCWIAITKLLQYQENQKTVGLAAPSRLWAPTQAPLG